MEHILLVVHVIITVSLIGVILLQRSSQDGMGLSGGSSNPFMTGRSSANLLTRTTAILATLFLANSLLLAYLATHNNHESSVIKKIESSQTAPAEPAPAPAQPATPSVPTN